MSGQALRARAEQVFRRGIGVPDNELVIERDDRRGKELESRE